MSIVGLDSGEEEGGTEERRGRLVIHDAKSLIGSQKEMSLIQQAFNDMLKEGHCEVYMMEYGKI